MCYLLTYVASRAGGLLPMRFTWLWSYAGLAPPYFSTKGKYGNLAWVRPVLCGTGFSDRIDWPTVQQDVGEIYCTIRDKTVPPTPDAVSHRGAEI